MKKHALIFVLIMCGYSFCHAQFTSELTDVKHGERRSYLVKSDGKKYRYDMEEDGLNVVMIVDPSSERTALLFPEKKQVQYIDFMSLVSEDPFQSFKYWEKKLSEKEVGTEKIWGFETVKKELYDGDQKVFTAWYSNELQFVLKMKNHLVENFYMEMTNIEQRKPDSTLFVVPDDYVEVDKQMRPVIPEPPPPESWKAIEATLPINGDFVRGDRITFKVPVGERYRIVLNNKTSEPAKIIRTVMEDGVELPKEKIGPISFRTSRLHQDESSSILYIGRAGDDVILEIHEGKLHIEIGAEEK